MNESILFKINKKIGNKTIITISWIALIFSLMNASAYFTQYVDNKFIFAIPTLIGFIFLVLETLQYVLLVIFLKKLYGGTKTKVYSLIIFGSTIIYILCNDIYNISYGFYSFYYLVDYFTIIFEVLFVIFCTSALFTYLKGVPKGELAIIAMIFGIIANIIKLFLPDSTIYYYFYFGHYMYGLCKIAELISHILLYATLLLCSIKFKTHTVLSKSINDYKKVSPEQLLNVLREKLERGMISQEEYEAQRTEIISNL